MALASQPFSDLRQFYVTANTERLNNFMQLNNQHKQVGFFNEEVGELNEAISNSTQPLMQQNKENIAREMGDVLLTLGILAQCYKINLLQAFAISLEKLKKRYDSVLSEITNASDATTSEQYTQWYLKAKQENPFNYSECIEP